MDWGFIFTSSPAGNMNFEKSPFKLTDEFVDVLNGMESKYFRHFRRCLIDGYHALHRKADEFITLVEMMTLSEGDLACFVGGWDRVIDELWSWLVPYKG